MKKTQKIFSLILALIITLSVCACNAEAPNNKAEDYFDGNSPIGDVEGRPTNIYGEESFDTAKPDGTLKENPFIKVEENYTSTFSADVDTASYTFLRKMINAGYSLDELRAMAEANLLRTEEIVNYFDYGYAQAEEGEMFGTKATIAKSPWRDDTYLLMLGIKAKEVEQRTANNLVFLIDVSGSMNSPDKLPLLQQAFSYLTDQLGENDTVSIVTYAGNERVVLEGAEGNKKEIILNAINTLNAGGSTNGEAGIVKAYELAERYYNPDGNNRIILASDGDLNVGIRDPKQLENLVEDKRRSGVFLSVLGFGSGNFRDDNMSAIAQTGNGVYHYIDCAAEAEHIFTDSLLSTIYTVAKDVKFQLSFDKDYVKEYRLIGYENRLLSNSDFNDDTKDAGEVGSGHTLTVCYELKLTDAALNGTDEGGTDNDEQANWMELSIRYKQPDSTVSELREIMLGEEHVTSTPDDDFKFVCAAIEFAMLIRNSRYRDVATTLEDIENDLSGINISESQSGLLELIRQLRQNENK